MNAVDPSTSETYKLHQKRERERQKQKQGIKSQDQIKINKMLSTIHFLPNHQRIVGIISSCLCRPQPFA